jgi:hypothetical protein
MRRTLIIVVVLAAAAIALGIVTAAFGAESDDDARLWAQMLERTRARAAENPFSGTVQVEWRDAAGTHREEIEISRTDDVVQVSAGTHVVSSSDNSVVGTGVAMTISAAPLPVLAAGKYDIKQHVGTAVAGRSTTRLDAILRSQEVVVARVYVDDETGLVLRRETFDEHGNLLRRVSFTRVEAEPPARTVTVPAARNAPVAKHELDPPYRDPSGVGVGFRRGPHQGRLSLPRLRRVYLGAGCHQQLHRVGAAGPGRNHQSGLSIPTGVIGIGPGLEQSAGEAGVAVGAGQRERRLSILVRGIYVGAGRDQQFRGGLVIQMSRPCESGRAIGLSRIHGRTLANQRLDGLTIAPLNGVQQAEIGRRQAGHADQQRRRHHHHGTH